LVEYGGGIDNGPAGQVGGGGGGGSPDLGQPVDFFGSVGDFVGDATNTILALPPEMLFLGVVAFIIGLAILRRAF
jgi:hypothetical protein